MLMTDSLRALVLGIVEGLTEFIPVSSTGHLILIGHWLGFTDQRAAVFEVAIQFGAVFAVLWQYSTTFKRLIRDVPHSRDARRLLFNLLIAILPVMLVGLFTHRWISTYLFRPVTVAWALLLGGVAMLLVEWRIKQNVETNSPRQSGETLLEISFTTALGIGFAQILSLFPGVSRSASTIMGGMVFGASRAVATEFSFLLSVPVIFAATGLDLVAYRNLLSVSDVSIFAIGIVAAFFSALIAIRVLIRFVASHSFVPFAWYRIVLGAILLMAIRVV